MKKTKLFVALTTFATLMFSSVCLADLTPLYTYSFDGDYSGTTPIERTEYYTDNGLVVSYGSSFSYPEGKLNSCLCMDGTEALKLSAKMTSESYTISYWMKPDRISDCTPSFMITADGFEHESFINFTLSVDSLSPCVWSYVSQPMDERYSIGMPGLLSTTDWIHVTLVVDETVEYEDAKLNYDVSLNSYTALGKYYVNGYFIAAGEVPRGICSETTEFWFGANIWDNFFQGCVDEIRIFNLPLNDLEVKENFVSSGGSKEQSLPIGNSSSLISGNKNNNSNGFSDDYITIEQGTLSGINSHLNLNNAPAIAAQGVETTTNAYSDIAFLLGAAMLFGGLGIYLGYIKKRSNSYT